MQQVKHGDSQLWNDHASMVKARHCLAPVFSDNSSAWQGQPIVIANHEMHSAQSCIADMHDVIHFYAITVHLNARIPIV